jgi:paraquat-inducible protein B
MSKQANKTLIGGFVIGAAAIVIIGILIFGSGRLMKDSQLFVLFFDGSVKGLNVGAPVQLKGVTMGEIKDIKMVADSDTMKFYTQVLIEVLPSKILWAGSNKPKPVELDEDKHRMARAMVEKGLRAKLEYISFVTGLLQVSFDFYPDTEVRITGIKTEFEELPTLPSDLEAITEKLGKLPISELVEETYEAVEGINKLVNSKEAQEVLASSNQSIQDIGALARKIDTQVIPVSSELTKTLKETRQLLSRLNQRVVPVGDEILTALKLTSSILEQLGKVTTELHELLEKDSEFRYNLREVLSETAEAAKSIRLLADYLEQHPEALIRGKSGGE